jgi:small-conductance mechanosensitive channel
MQKIIEYISKTGYTHLISTFTLIVLVLTLRSFLIKNIRKKEWRSEDKRKWYVTIRNWSSFTIFFGLVIIWATELQTFALSIVAITGAMIISGKELILCAHGGLLRSFNNMFKVGDRIEVGGIRGDVIDANLMITKVLEIGPENFTHQFTGRSIIIPNSLFLTDQVINESFLNKYVLHVFKVSISREEDWKKAEECMMAAANEACSDFIEKAQNNMDHLAKKEGLDVPRAAPRITYKFSNAKEIEMIIRVPSPAARKGNIEQEILKRFMEKYLPTKA